MIQMQRSLSLPGPAHASPPVSPTITYISSRNQTPSPADKYGVPPRIHRYQSRSPHRPPTSYKEQPEDQERTHSKPRVSSPARAVENGHSTIVSRTEPAAPPKQQQLPLLQDISQYITPQISTFSEASATTSLAELAHLVRLSTYQERKRVHSRLRLQRSLVSTALSARLARCGELAYRTMVDNFRSDDKKAFASLYNAVHDVRNSCDATRKYALLEPELENARPYPGATDVPTTSSLTFIHEIPQRSRESFLNFLTQIRTNPDYLASRLTSLTTAELGALTTFHQHMEPIDSVLPFHNQHGRAKGLNTHRFSAAIPSAIERLLSFQRHDPLSALIHTCFANSAGPNSVEDRRRTDVWATACARLVKDNRQGTDSFICSVLNVWVNLRDWSGRSNMEWYLMKILEDGAFLLDRAEEQPGSRGHVESRNAKDSIVAEEFFDTAIHGLFQVVDDPEVGGLPEGLIELGNAILRKLDPKYHPPMRRFFISKWLFTVFLLNCIIHPETYGMMSDYHITEYGRQRILKEVAMRAQKLVVDKLWKTASPPPAIGEHIDNIMARFNPKKQSRSNTKLLPARSITSLRETAEVHPYIVIGPADLVTMVNALFPERRPASSSLSKEHFNGLRSGGSSISSISALSRSMSGPRVTYDNASVMSNSGSSVISDNATSREPLLNDNSSANLNFSATNGRSPSGAPTQTSRLSFYEDDGFELRMSIHEMTQALGMENITGTCHPCAERWAVLFMSPDGQKLSTQMMHDPDDELDEEESTSSSDDDDEGARSRPDLDKDYHQLRDSILKLVEDYEIPQFHDSGNETQTFSNRTSTLESPRKKYRSRPGSITKTQSRNPYRPRDYAMPLEGNRHEETAAKQSRPSEDERETESQSVLITMLDAAGKQCQAQSDFVNAHLYWKTLNQLHQLSSQSLKKNGFASLLNIFSRGPRDIIRRSTGAVEEYDAWLVWLKQSQERHDVTVESMMKRQKALRDKMWYVADVRVSKPYECAKNIAIALKCMTAPKRKQPPQSMRPRTASRVPANGFIHKTEAQVMAEVAASDDQGGPNKLSDDQSENTLRWLSQFGIENFCRGEERIHRFSMEIETCINKLVGDSMMEAPDLWSSELYFRDFRMLDSGRHRGDPFLNNFRSLNISGDDSHEAEAGRRGLRSTDFNRHNGRDLRSMSMRNGSQQSFDSSRYSVPRISTSSEAADSQDYFSMASPVLSIDSSATFWSPFQTRSQSPSTSFTSHRPGTSSSSTNETVMLREERASQAKQRLLDDLKRTLTSLLLSDLGTLVFSQGSETDTWFSGSLGQDCMDMKEEADRKAARRRSKSKKRTLEKKRSFRDLRRAQNTDATFERSPSHQERPEKGAAIKARPSQEPSIGTPDAPSINGSSTTASDSATTSTRRNTGENATSVSKRAVVKELESPDFPYRKSFQRLLRMFSVHPNPYVKLNALYELEHLIVASLTPSAPRRPRIRQDPFTPSPDVNHFSSFGNNEATTTTPRAKNLEQSIDNCRERRSQTIGSVDISSPYFQSDRSSNQSGPATTDMIVDVLQDLFRDASIRPKTLFRDLQFIASFVPASILDKTDRGKAFWDAGLAALGLKQDVCRTLIEVADGIVAHYATAREHRLFPAESQPTGALMKYGMEDAARMLTITAKEGDPVAQRELGIFYIAHPEMVERVTAPLSKPRETFKSQVMELHSDGSAGRADPATMCVAYHWMGLSAFGGDDVAKRYLKQRGSQEINEIP